MNESNMKNMVVLKNLPSNIVEEAYVILKPNQKLKKNIKNHEETGEKITSDYVVKEAEMVVSNYLSNLEDNKKIRNLEVKKIERKYKQLRKLTFILGGILFLNILANII